MVKKANFDYYLFYNAMANLLTRKPDFESSSDGYCEFHYVPLTKEEKEDFRMYQSQLARWLDIFEIQFSGSRCEFGKMTRHGIRGVNKDADILHVKVSWEVAKKEN